MTNYKNLWLVGIGASAGGYESIQKFLSHITSQKNVSYIIALHLDPTHSSKMGEILSTYTSLKVKEIKNDLNVESNIVYFCPPNKDFIIKNGKFILTIPTSSSKPSIDKFFTSLAKEKKEKAIGIILSGSGTDGANGIEEIAKNGGVTLCEDKNAKHYYMPKSALDTGDIDASLSSEVLAESIPDIIEDKNYFLKYSDIKIHLKEVFKLLNQKINIDFSNYKEGTLIRRIEKRMKTLKSNNMNDYIELLKKDKNEIEKLKNEFFIIVTSFFRDKEAFFALKDELKRVIKKSNNETIRIWNPACATSQEVYSISILLFEIFEELQISKKVTIFATDISDKIIQEARTKTFTQEEINEIDKIYIEKYFEKVENKYKPKKELREMIVFSQHDLIKDPPFLNMDLISCRNLLIYFNSELQKRVFGIFYYSLKPDGLLFLGKSETIGNLGFLFSAVNTKYKIYKKSSDLEKMDIDTLIQKTNLIPKSKKVIKTNKIMDIDYSIVKAVTEVKTTSGVVIDKSNNILFYKGDCSEYLTHPQGLNSNNILYLVKDYLKLDLRVLLNQMKIEKKYMKSKKIPIVPINDKKEYFIIEIFPLEKNRLGEETYFISFSKKIADKVTNDISKYEEEIVRLKDKLQKTLESLEIANEELRVANEELQSTNEELQSTNEELETSNEELQSTNEELQTVNEELQTTNADLEFSNKVFNEVVGTLNSSFIVFDKELNVIKYTSKIDNFFNTINLENKNLSTIMLYSKLEIPTLLEDMKNCLFEDKESNYDIEYQNREYFVSIHRINIPIFYKNNNLAQKGIVLTFIDKTEMVRKDKILFQQSKMASMGEMIGNIAHQWRQPLNLLSATIMEFCLDLRDECDEDRFDKFENETNEIIQKMSNTIDDFRNFFRPDKVKSNFSVKKAIEEALKFTNASYKDNNILLVNNIQKDIFVNGFESELTQVILNILNNSKDAIKENHIKNGKVVIDLLEDEKNIIISIEDNGGGIPENILGKVFEPYFTTKFKTDGTGLGLYMSKMIIEAMGGKMEFKNEKDLKLKLNIFLPK